MIGMVEFCRERGDDRGAVDVGQSEVEDDQVGVIGGGGRDGVAAGVGGGDGVAVGGEVDPEGPQDVGVVVDDEHVGHRAGPAAAAEPIGGSRWIDRQGDHHGEAPARGGSARRVPPIASVNPRATARPRPTPLLVSRSPSR